MDLSLPFSLGAYYGSEAGGTCVEWGRAFIKIQSHHPKHLYDIHQQTISHTTQNLSATGGAGYPPRALCRGARAPRRAQQQDDDPRCAGAGAAGGSKVRRLFDFFFVYMNVKYTTQR